MHTFTNRQRLEIAAYLVTLALAVPCFVAAALMNDSPRRDFLINLSAAFAGVDFIFHPISVLTNGSTLQQLSATDFFKDDLPDMHERFSRAQTTAIPLLQVCSSKYCHYYQPNLQPSKSSERMSLIADKSDVVNIATNNLTQHYDAIIDVPDKRTLTSAKQRT